MDNSLEGDGLGHLIVWPQHPWKTSGFSQHHWQRALPMALQQSGEWVIWGQGEKAQPVQKGCGKDRDTAKRAVGW